MEKRTCIQCGKEFEISDSEQEFFQSKNLQMPKRCKECRNANKKEKRNMRKNGNGSTSTGNSSNIGKSSNNSNKSMNNKMKNSNAKNLYNSQKVEPYDGQNSSKHSVKDNSSDNVRKSSGSNGVNRSNRPNTSYSNNKNKNDNSTSKFGFYGLLVLILIVAVFFGRRVLLGTGDENSKNQSGTQAVSTVQTVSLDEADSDENLASTVDYFFKNDELRAEHFEKHGGDFNYANASEYEAGASKVVNSPEALHKLESEDGDDVYYIESTNEFVIVSKAGYIRTYFKPSRGLEYYEEQ